MKKFALAGNPNCGKTTLFNELTGSNQYVGNWAGVTVEKKEGNFHHNGEEITLVDLPGIYSLSPYTMEEIVARDFVVDEHPAAIINIIDGTNIERNLYLTLQLMELGCPVVVAVNMMDDVAAKGDTIDCEKLGRYLGVPVLPIVARKGENTGKLIEAAVETANVGLSPSKIKYDAATDHAIREIKSIIQENPENRRYPLRFYAAKLLEADDNAAKRLNLTAHQNKRIEQIICAYEKTSEFQDRDTLLADARYRYITDVVSKSVVKKHAPGHLTLSDKIDRVVTNRILAIPIFLLIMFVMFAVTFGPLGSTLQGIVEWLVNDVAAQGLMSVLTAADAPAWTIGLIIDAAIGGVGSVLTFLPQIMLLFLFLSILEDSGYMARAAFIMDRLLRRLGLTGKSFIPMLMGFGCTTPAVMAARTMENEKDRRLTIMLTPFMSCGARLPIYALFAGIFFTENQGVIVFTMYTMGLVVAILCGLLLKNTLFKGDAAPFVMELPAYRLPTLKSTMLHMWDKCKGFLIKAGTVIFSMSILIWILQNFNLRFEMVSDSAQSIFGQFGQWIAPLFAPLGFGTWQASVALLTGLVAKEAVVSTLSVLYGATGSATALAASLSQSFTPLSAFSFMTFCLLYMPCIAAFVAVKKEMNSMKWALGTAVFQTTVAYVVALAVFQFGTLAIHLFG